MSSSSPPMSSTNPATHRMLNQVPSETLLHLFSSVLAKTSPPGPTNIPSLDAHLLATPHHALNRGDLVEIQGPSSSGKSQLLYLLLANCLLPYSCAGTVIGGWEKAAVMLDTDASFDICRFNQVLTSRLPSDANTTTKAQISERSLSRLHVFRTTSSTQLAATIMNLPDYMASRSFDAELGLVAIDSMSAYYWTDRFIAEQLRLAPSNPGKPITGTFESVVSALQSLRLSRGPVIIVTNWSLISNPDQTTPDVPYKQHLVPFPVLSATFPTTAPLSLLPHTCSTLDSDTLPLTHHICLAPHTCSDSSEEATVESSEEFTGTVRSSGSSEIGSFIFRVTKDGIFEVV